MNSDEHVQRAREFLQASDREFEAGEILQGSEKLWEAATHALMALMTEEVKLCKGHRDFDIAVRRLADERGDQSIRLTFVIAEMFYYNSQFGFMEDWQIADDREELKEILARVLPDFAMRRAGRLEG